MREPSHGLGGSGAEVRLQHRKVVAVPELTTEVLHRSGIKRGSHVLDLGCGVGDISLLIARLVGPTGLVVGVDEQAQVIDLAERRATVARQCYWARFVAADPSTFIAHELFDAVVVRLDIRLQPEHATFARLSACIHPDGVIMILASRPSGSPTAPSNRE